jgi:SAM-dependent methyltransferase
MSAFNAYSKYYDLLYKDKDYSGEAEYIHKLIQKYAPGVKSILNLGCGTGRHDIFLAEKGYTITGVDISEDMISIARANLSATTNLANKTNSTCPTFLCDDIRTIRLCSKFDAVISLFHVISYQTSNSDLQETFATVRAHLNPDGFFIFDCWYGPAVLSDRPQVRIKRMANHEIEVTRTAKPFIHANSNIVNVNYEILIKDKEKGSIKIIKETHRMRYLFYPELKFMLKASGFTIVNSLKWMTFNRPLGFDSWYGVFITRK